MMSQKPQIPKISELQMQLKAWLAGDRKTLIQNGIIAAAFLGFIFFFFLPVWSHNQKTAAQVKDLKERIQSADVKIARIPEMNRQKEMYGARTKETREQFFDAKDTEKLIEIISTTAASAGVKISVSSCRLRIDCGGGLSSFGPFYKPFGAISQTLRRF